MYFIPCTIKLQPEYQHLSKQFSPIINLTHPKYLDTTTKYPHLSKYIYQNQHHPPPRILHALMTIINLIRETYNHLLVQIPTPNWTTILLEQMTLLQNPPERHILNTHLYTLFTQSNQNLIKPPNSIHKEIYIFIKREQPKHKPQHIVSPNFVPTSVFKLRSLLKLRIDLSSLIQNI